MAAGPASEAASGSDSPGSWVAEPRGRTASGSRQGPPPSSSPLLGGGAARPAAGGSPAFVRSIVCANVLRDASIGKLASKEAAAVLRLLEGPAKGGCGRRLLPESMSDRRLIDDLPEGTAGASCSFFVFFGQPCRCPFFLQLCPGGQRQSCGAAAGCSMLLWRPSGEAASAGSAIKPVCIVRTDRCPFRNDYTFDCGATSHVTPSRAAAREVATGRPPPTRTTPLRPLALSFPSH